MAGMKICRFYSRHMNDVKNKNKPSMLEAFNNKELLRKCLYNRFGITHDEVFNITPAMIRQGLRNSYTAAQTSVFKPMVAKYIYDRYTKCGDVVYDFSMGFGQRFLAAMSLTRKNLKYIGCDPWKECLNIRGIVELLDIDESRYVFENIGSEYYCPKEYIGKVSLAFSSPPYYDYEIYDNGNEMQAYGGGIENYEKWFIETMNNIEKLLKPGGILALNFPAEIYEKLKGHMNFEHVDTLYIKLSKNNKFRKGELKTEPIYIFKKKETSFNNSEDETEHIINRYLDGDSSEKIAKELGFNGSTVCRRLKKNGIDIRPSTENKLRCNRNDAWLDCIDDEEKAYFLGLMYTDGTVHSKRNECHLSLGENDIGVLERFSDIIYGENKIRIYDVKGSSLRSARLSIYGKKFHDNLIKHGCVPKKTFSLSYPYWLGINKDLNRHFIRGLFDGDGCLYLGEKRSCIDFTGTEKLLKGIVDFANGCLDLDLYFAWYKGKKHRDTITTLRVNRRLDVMKFLDFIYKDATVYLKRKHDKYEILKSKQIL